MDIRLEPSAELGAEEVVIRYGVGADTLVLARRLFAYAEEQDGQVGMLTCFRRERKEEQEHLLPYAAILFFETEGEVVYAHTVDAAYRVRWRLYELERLLPDGFIRISKSTILHMAHVTSVRRNLTASSPVTLRGTHKQVYVSRLYYKPLREKMQQRYVE